MSEKKVYTENTPNQLTLSERAWVKSASAITIPSGSSFDIRTILSSKGAVYVYDETSDEIYSIIKQTTSGGELLLTNSDGSKYWKITSNSNLTFSTDTTQSLVLFTDTGQAYIGDDIIIGSKSTDRRMLITPDTGSIYFVLQDGTTYTWKNSIKMLDEYTLSSKPIYSSTGLRSLPSGNGNIAYWSSLDTGIYWYGNTGAVPNLPANFGMISVMRLGVNQTSVVFYSIGSLQMWYKWNNQETNASWKEIQMVDDSGWQTLSTSHPTYYRKKNGIVTVTVINNNSALANGDIIGTLPSGYRPSYTMTARNRFDNANGGIAIYDTGVVQYQSNTGNANYIQCTITYPV